MQIDFDETARLISDLLQKTTLNNISKGISIGGVFNADQFRLQPGMNGVLLWFCYNPGPSDLPGFFMSVEQIPQYQGIVPVPGPNVIRPVNVFTYTENDIDPLTVKSYLLRQPSIRSNTGLPIPAGEVSNLTTNFKSLMTIASDVYSDPYCVYPFSFFGETPSHEIQQFLDQGAVSVKYFFGYDESERPNRIRVILIAVDSNGNNILGSSAIMLQKSFPPPPYQ